MLDGSPFNLFEYCRYCDGAIGEHKYREGEEVFYYLAGRAVDNVPFSYQRDKADHEYQHIDYRAEIEQRHHTEFEKYRKFGIFRKNSHTVDKFRDTAAKRKDGEHQRGEDRHKHIVASEFALENALEKLSAVFAEHLIKAL